MVHEAMVLEYTGRHLASIELAASLKVLLYPSLVACLFVPWGLVPSGGAVAPLAIGVVAYIAKLAAAVFCSFRDLDRQDAGVPRAGIPGRRVDARSASDPSPVRLAEPVDARRP